MDSAIDKCLEESSCTGVVQIVSGQSIYQLRSDKKLRDSPRGEVTWVKLCADKALKRIEEIAAETPPPQCFLDGPIKGFLGILHSKFTFFFVCAQCVFDVILKEIVLGRNVRDIIILMML